MPIYEYRCDCCGKFFERVWSWPQIKTKPSLEFRAFCGCGCLCPRSISPFNFTKIGPVSGIDDTDDLTLGKIVQERGIPAEFRPTIAQVQHREEMKNKDKEYKERIKRYGLEKLTKAELNEKAKTVEIIPK